MPGLKKIKEIKLSPNDAGGPGSGGIWDMAVDEKRRRCYFISQPNGGGVGTINIGCIAYKNNEYVLHEQIEMEASQSFCVNECNGNLFFGYASGENEAYQVRVVDPNNNYAEIATIDIPPLDPSQSLGDSDFYNMVFSNKSGRLYIYSGPEIPEAPLRNTTFQFIVCDGLENEFIKSTAASIYNNVGLGGRDVLKIYRDIYGFIVNDQVAWGPVGGKYNGICVYNIEDNKVSLIDHSTFIIKQEVFNPIDICIEEGWHILFALIQSDKTTAILRIGLDDQDFKPQDDPIIFKKVNSEPSIMFYDKTTSLIYIIYNTSTQPNEENIVLIDPFNKKVTYAAGIEENITAFAFDQTNRLLYVANDDKSTVSIFEVMG